MQTRQARAHTVLALVALVAASLSAAGADIYVRFRVLEPAAGKLEVWTRGHRHSAKPAWYLPREKIAAVPGAWSEWLDLTKWPVHRRMNRVGGIAEWPSMKLTVRQVGVRGKVQGCVFEVQLADQPNLHNVVIEFSERSGSDTIAFLLPHPLRQHKDEFEAGSQITARHLRWAREVTGGKAARLKDIDICTTLWGHYDPDLAKDAVETLRLLGFNVVNGAPRPVLRDAKMRVLGKTWVYGSDPDQVKERWGKFADGSLKRTLASEDGKWFYDNMAHLVVSDEVKTLNFQRTDPEKLQGWFQDYLRDRGVTDRQVGWPAADRRYPATEMYAKTLPRQADLPTRRRFYYAAKFGHWWSARQMRLTSDLIRQSLPGMKTETLPSSHGFFDAWGPPHIGMSYRMLDLFELAAQGSVDVLSSEDWLGLNHMYGPNYTWTGAQSFAYLNAITASAIGERPTKLLALITPSDDKYLRLKAYSSLAQGAKGFFFWTFGPTYIGTENYWSDLKSEYEGVHKLTRALAAAEDILTPAKSVRDPVAILYSVSHDIWHSDQPAAFVEKRLLWHALRHAGVQPDFLREEDLEAGRLKDYKALYIADWCVSQWASTEIDKWVRQGGVVYLSAGAATRDEFYEPYAPPYAAAVWPERAAGRMIAQRHRYNERRDLPQITPLTHANRPGGPAAEALPVLGVRLDLADGVAEGKPLLVFDDNGAPAGVKVAHGQGTVFAYAFLPMLAYARLADFQPRTLAEKWPALPRQLVRQALAAASVKGVAQADAPVVETGLLTGPKGSVLVLANYTYEPIKELHVDLRLSHPVTQAVSTEGVRVTSKPIPGGLRLSLPLDWTDMVLLPHAANKDNE